MEVQNVYPQLGLLPPPTPSPILGALGCRAEVRGGWVMGLFLSSLWTGSL